MRPDHGDQPDIVVVGGAGHVGLPLSLKLAQAGHRVGILDVSQHAIDTIASGQMPFMERGADEILAEVLPTGRLTFSTDSSMIDKVRVVIVVIGTPIDEFMNPSLTLFDEVIDGLMPHFAEDALLVLRSTVFPGTTLHLQRRFKAANVKVRVAFCPERIAEGHAIEELASLPQVVGADDPVTLQRATDIFSSMGAQSVAATAAEAEFAKLFTNSWRYMKFAVANQFFMIANEAGQDYDRILHAIRYDYPRAADLPGPGFAAGPCLLKDTMQLASFTPDHFPMGQSARQINEGLPTYLVTAMERRFGDLLGRRIGLMGMAFKGESDDPRDSLSYKLRRLLQWEGAEVLCTDPYVADTDFLPLYAVLERADILVIGAPHDRYRELDLGGKPLVDVWGLSEAGILRLMDPGSTPEVTFVIPVFNEPDNIESTLRSLQQHVSATHDILVVYDFEGDSTVPVVEALQPEMAEVRLLRNDLGRGVLNAMKAGIAAAPGDYVIVSMADGSDDYRDVDGMLELARSGADVVAGSRYMKGGQQIGGPPVKRLLSRAAGLSLHYLGGVATHDPTNNFKLYRRDFLDDVTIESEGGFELALELTVKATLQGREVAEVPTVWRDRTAGDSNFKMRAWIPRYLRWYAALFAGHSKRVLRRS